MFRNLFLSSLVGTMTLSPSFSQDLSKVEISPEKISSGIYFLKGAGGNIGVSIGKDGTFIIDDQFAPLTDKIEAALKKLSGQTPKFVINTHWHSDHTGGNENFGKRGSIIVAHENVRTRMKKGQFISGLKMDTPATPHAGLPVVTFTKNMSLHMNGEKIDIIHPGSGHTDGDSVIHFTKSDVIHAGDIFFNGKFPFIDVSSGGSIDGIISSAERIKSLSTKKTKIIPGHGPLASIKDLEAYIEMLKSSKKIVSAEKAKGRSLKEVVKSKPLKELAEKWEWQFINQDRFVQFIFNSL